MAAGDVSRRGLAASALLAAALGALPVRTVDAACGAGNRVDHADAECLSAWWKNRGLFRKSPYHVRNLCPEYGKVVAKVDLKLANDRTLHLSDGHPRDGDTRHRIRGISCCSDAGALCNRSDVVTDTGCLSRFLRTSTAAWSCMNETAVAAISGENYRCTVTARCKTGEFRFNRPVYSDTSITVAWLDLDDVQNCAGVLKHDACTPSRATAPSLSVGDARAGERAGASLDFRVTLSRAHSEPVTVRYATSDGTAKAGSDYLRTSGTLAFAANETSKMIPVPVLDDDHDEGPETLILTLSAPAPSQVRLADAEATGTIANTDRIPGAWLARFGRTVTDHALDALAARMRTSPASGAEARLAGQEIGPGPRFGMAPDGDATLWPSLTSGPGRRTSGRALPEASSFSLTAETGGSGVVSIWGAGAATRLSGRDGDLATNGEVASALFGADWTYKRWTTGLMVSHSRGVGTYRGAGAGTATSTLTAAWPWIQHTLSERLSLWGVAGYGVGSLALEPEGARAIRTDMRLRMFGAGLRSLVVDGGEDDFTLVAKTDATIVRTSSDAVSGSGGNLAAAAGDVTRLRLGLEGSRPLRLADASVLTPRVEIGVRRDGGDAGTGFGADVGASIAWQDAVRGLGAELRGHVLLDQGAEGERGISAFFTWDPVTGDRGPHLSLTRMLGVATQGGAGALPGRTTLAGLAVNDSADALHQRRLEARFGYGIAAFGNRFTATPELAVALSNTGRDYSLGWRLTRRVRPGDTGSLELSFEARRHESTSSGARSEQGARPVHEAGFRFTERY